MTEFMKMGARRRNEIVMAVNEGLSKEEANLKSEAEKQYFDSMIKQGEEFKKEHGEFPLFELEELDYEDPELDMFND